MESTLRSILRTSALTLTFLPALHAQVGAATQTTLALSPSATIATTHTVNLVAKVSSSGAPVHPGVVLFCNAKALHCEDSAILGSAQLTAVGTATLPLRLSPNTYSIKAVFRGTPRSSIPREPSTSTAQTLTITGLAASLVSPVTASQSSGRYKLSSIVAGYGTAPLTGTVAFNDTVLHGTPLTLGSATLPSTAPTAQLSAFTLATYANSFIPVLSGDFNNDGLTDLVALAYDSNQDQNLGTSNLAIHDASACNITPMLGNGDGTFTAQTPNPIPSCVDPPIAVADINGDGIADLMLSGSQSFSSPSILLGKGDGTFTLSAATEGVPRLARWLDGTKNFMRRRKACARTRCGFEEKNNRPGTVKNTSLLL
jgi:hypothetical protein